MHHLPKSNSHASDHNNQAGQCSNAFSFDTSGSGVFYGFALIKSSRITCKPVCREGHPRISKGG